MSKDMTSDAFLRAIARRGWKLRSTLGYVEVGGGLHVSRFNGGERLRDQLAYLAREERRWLEQLERDGRDQHDPNKPAGADPHPQGEEPWATS